MVGPVDARHERFEALAHEVIEPVRRFLVRRTDAATADDVLGDTLLVLWRRFDEVPDNALPWAYAVARRCLSNAARGRARQVRVAGRLAAQPPPEVAAGDADAELHEALARLRPDDAELLRLWAWEQLTAAEIATVLDLTSNAVSIRLHRAKAKLRDELRKKPVDAGQEQSEGRQR